MTSTFQEQKHWWTHRVLRKTSSWSPRLRPKLKMFFKIMGGKCHFAKTVFRKSLVFWKLKISENKITYSTRLFQVKWNDQNRFYLHSSIVSKCFQRHFSWLLQIQKRTYTTIMSNRPFDWLINNLWASWMQVYFMSTLQTPWFLVWHHGEIKNNLRWFYTGQVSSFVLVSRCLKVPRLSAKQ